MMYEVCPLCGSSLDFGEKCGCEEEKENEPSHANENGSFKRIPEKRSYPKYIIKPDDCQAGQNNNEPEEKYNTEKAIAAQKAYCERNGLSHFAPAFDGTCFYCERNIYAPYSEGNKKPTGYTVEEAGRRHIFCCPHCRKFFSD